jgi:small subunit ribosomal protein S4
MARYTGPRDRISRRFGVPLFGPTKSLERRAYPPGVHGARGMRRKQSDYAIMLAEKQKLRMQYGLLEKQFRKTFAEAKRRGGVTGVVLLQLLELRLDNVVYRAGFANTRAAARQFVGHRHILVNGKRVNISSFRTKPGDVISVHSSPKSQQVANRFLDATQGTPTPEWVTVDKDKLSVTVNRVPERDEMEPHVNEQLVVEYYSRV